MCVFLINNFLLTIAILFSILTNAQEKQKALEKEFTSLDLLAEKGDYKAGIFYSKKLLPSVQKRSGNNSVNLLRTYCYLIYFNDKLDHKEEVTTLLAKIKEALPSSYNSKSLEGTVKSYALLSDFFYQRGVFTNDNTLLSFINTHQSDLLPFERELINYYYLYALYQKGFLNEASEKINPALLRIEKLLNNDTIRTADGEKKYASLSNNDQIERKNLLAKYLLLKSMVLLKNGLADSSIVFINSNQSILKEDLASGEGYKARIHYQLGLAYADKHEYGKAENEFKIASSLAERYFLPHAPTLIDIKHNLIKTLLEEGKTGEAVYYNNDADMKVFGYYGTRSLAYHSNTFPDIESEMYYQNWPEVEKRVKNLLTLDYLPEHHLIRAKALDYLFESLVKQQKNEEAEKVMSEMLDLQKALITKQSPAYSLLILKKAIFYSTNLNKFTEAKGLFKEITDSGFWDQISIENPSYYKNMTSLSRLYMYMEEYKESSKILRNELVKVEKERSSEHPLYAVYLSHLGELNICTGEFANANTQLDKSLGIFEKKPTDKYSIEYIEALELKIKAAILQGDYAPAKIHLKKAENIAKHLKTSAPEDLFLLEETGLLYIKTGKYQQAEKYLGNMLKAKERNLGKTHKSLFTILLYLGDLQMVTGNYSEADDYFERAAGIAKTAFGTQSVPYATCMLYYKDLYAAIGDYEKRESSIKESLEIYKKSYGENNIKSGVLIHELALASFEADLYSGRKAKNTKEEIEQLFSSSLQIIKNTEGEKSIFYAEGLEDYAFFNAQTAQNTKALSNIQMARTIWDNKIGGTNENSARLNLLSGKIYYLANNYAEALKAFEKTRDEYKNIFDDNHPNYVEALGRCSQIYYILGNIEKAVSSIEECTDKSMQYIDQIFPFLSERGKMAYWDKIKNNFEFYKTIVFSNNTNKEEMAGKIFNIQLKTKSLLLNSLLKIKNRIYASGDTTSIRLYQEWQHIRDDLSIAYSMNASQRKENEVNLSNLELSLEQIEKSLSEISSDFAEGNKTSNKSAYTWKNVQKTLGDNETLIEVIPFRHFEKNFSDSTWYAFVAINNKSKVPAFVVIKNGYDLEKKYLKYYRSSRMFNIPDEYSYAIYWKPLEPLMDETHTTIYFSGDGVYNQINPETFMDKSGNYLINQKNIVSIGSGRDLINRASTLTKKSKNTIVSSTVAMVGNPTYYEVESESNRSIAQLPGSEIEVKKIDELLKGKGWLDKVYIGKDATEETIKAIQSPKVYHISTHGFFWKDDVDNAESELNENNISNPLLKSGLVLYNGGTLLQSANINTINQSDGILTAYEAMNLSLDNTELVVLSACETGLGEVKIGEGVYGLQRAFTVAGAHCIIMSLSKVSDEVTISLMTNFYNYWLKTGNKREAFMLAKKELITTYPDPKYWGSFVMIGID